MNSMISTAKRFGASALFALVAAGLAGCDGLLDVDDPESIRDEELAGPASVPTVIRGAAGDFRDAVNGYVLYSSLFTDEMVLAGTFPTRLQVDQRRVTEDPDNATVTDDLYEPIQQARVAADSMVERFRRFQDDPDFEGQSQNLAEGIAIGLYTKAYMYTYLAELYCESVVDTVNAPVGPDVRMQQALDLYREAEQAATDAGLDDYVNASKVGQGRALLWLGQYQEAAAAVADVPRDFLLFVEHSTANVELYNDLYQFTVGDQEVIRWTVGNGGADSRNESFMYFDEWVDLQLITPNAPGLTAFNSSIEVHLQREYPNQNSGIIVASGLEARLIEAEAAIRAGDFQGAEDILNDLRSDFVNRFTTTPGRPALTRPPLDPITLETTQEEALRTYARERERELWLTGDRQATSRRLLQTDGIDLYPDREGDDTCFPIPQQELDNNPVLGG